MRAHRQPNKLNIPDPREGMGAIFAAFVANVGIAISKYVVFFMTGASSMLAEAVHSTADISNQVLLLLGSKRAKRHPTPAHPFGFGRAHFLYGFMVSITLFILGGVFAIYEGIHKIYHPAMIEQPYIAYIVLAISMMLEGYALHTTLREASSFKPEGLGWWRFIRQTKSVNHIVLALEDATALIGLSIATIGITLTLVTNNPAWDGLASLLIGALLVIVASILFLEVQSLLIGESMGSRAERVIKRLARKVAAVENVVDLKTLYTGPAEVIIAMKITVDKHSTAETVSQAIDEIEARIRQKFPIAHLIYIEPDIFKSKRQQELADKKIQTLLSDK